LYERKGEGGLLAMAVKQQYNPRDYYGWYLEGRNYVSITQLS
jgi:hypothetical protein